MAGRRTRYKGSLSMNVLNTLGLISSSFGLWMGVEGGDVELAHRDGQERLSWGPTTLDVFFAYDEVHDRADSRAIGVEFGAHSMMILHPLDVTLFQALFNRARDWLDIAEVIEAGSVDQAVAVAELTEVVGYGDTRVRRLAELSGGPERMTQ